MLNKKIFNIMAFKATQKESSIPHSQLVGHKIVHCISILSNIHQRNWEMTCPGGWVMKVAADCVFLKRAATATSMTISEEQQNWGWVAGTTRVETQRWELWQFSRCPFQGACSPLFPVLCLLMQLCLGSPPGSLFPPARWLDRSLSSPLLEALPWAWV